MAKLVKITEPSQPEIVLSITFHEAEELLDALSRDAEENENWYLVNSFGEALKDGIRECAHKIRIPSRFLEEP